MMAKDLFVFESSFELLNIRTKTTWYSLMLNIQRARSDALAHTHLHTGKGFLQALRDAELIDNMSEGVMGFYLHRAWMGALERLKSVEV